MPTGPYIRYEQDGWTYHFTQEDAVWLARALWGEGGTRPDAVAWTAAQRFALLRNSGLHRSFAAYLRAYSQPINPKWQLGGQFCPQVGSGDCSADRLERRAEISTAAWETIPIEDREMALAFIEGQLPNPVPGAIHWATPPRVERTHLAQDPEGQVLLADSGNAFFVPSRLADWTGIEVTVSGSNVFGPGAAGASGGAVFVGAGKGAFPFTPVTQRGLRVPLGWAFGIAALATVGGTAYYLWQRRG